MHVTAAMNEPDACIMWSVVNMPKDCARVPLRGPAVGASACSSKILPGECLALEAGWPPALQGLESSGLNSL